MNFYAGLPNDLATRIRRIVEPHVLTERQRINLITEAFYTVDPRISGSIEYSGTAVEFARQCTNHLIQNVMCLLGSEEHSVSRLLQVLRDQCGFAEQAQIDEIVALLDPRCREDSTIEKMRSPNPSELPAPKGVAIQTEKTPPNDRMPSVFVSYSHRDLKFAKRLISDLQDAGHFIWIDMTDLKGGDEWVRTIAEGIINSYAFVVVVTQHALESKWVQDEILWAKQRERLIIPLILDRRVINTAEFFSLNRYQGIDFTRNYRSALSSLLSSLPSPVIPSVTVKLSTTSHTTKASQKLKRTQRESELEYLDRLRLEVLLNTEKYTALAGQSEIMQDGEGRQTAAFVMKPEFALLERDLEQTKEIRRFENAVEEILALRRAVVLGEPGAGKTTTLWRLASDLTQKAIHDPNTPIPLVIRLGRWTDETQLFKEFVRLELGNLGIHLDKLLETRRAALLIDGLNEIPVLQRKSDRADKDHQVAQFVSQHPELLAVISCRAQDYNTDLGFNRIEIQPLDPVRIYQFLSRYLDPVSGKGSGERLFWQLVGGLRLQQVWEKWKKAGASLKLFFEAKSVPQATPNVRSLTSGKDDRLWRDYVRQPSSLMGLARNPYLLTMLVQVFQTTGEIPQNRGKLFQSFVSTLFARENIIQINKQTGSEQWSEDAVELLRDLSELAYEMQRRRSQFADDTGDALTVLPLQDVKSILNQHQIYLANSASVLTVGESVRFTHQLLQEYFAAVALRGRVFAQYGPHTMYFLKTDLRLKATDIWRPARWWERTNWEEAAVLLTGLYSDDCTPVIEWLMDANPEVTADCIVRSGAKTPDSTLLRLRDRWINRLTHLKLDPVPRARTAVGRALGKLRLDTDEPLDNRKGVSVVRNGEILLPDLDWCEIRTGQLMYQAFQIGRYPVTYAQFQCFIDAPDFNDDHWWIEMPNYQETNGQVIRTREITDQGFKFSNHPRESVSWYQAVAFCRWLTHKVGYKVDLPTEQQWEKAARGTGGWIYPYGETFNAAKENTEETGIGQTSAVGIFPDGHSPDLVHDMSGNVWEWCLNKFNSPEMTAVDTSGDPRVVRGGSWRASQYSARTTHRVDPNPDTRHNSIGFRLCRLLSQ